MRTTCLLPLYFLFSIVLQGQTVDLDTFTIREREARPQDDSLSSKQLQLHKPLDLAEVLAAELPQVGLIRKAGTANDLTLRGLYGDNLNVLNDDRKLYGACMNRMDPPAAHSSNEQIQSIEIVESVFDITRSGSLGGRINVVTRDPMPGLGLRGVLTVGEFAYRSVSAELNGGNEDVQALAAYTYQESDAYEDGAGASLHSFPDNTASRIDDYQELFLGEKAFETEKMQVKANWKLAENRTLKASFSSEDSTDVLYPGLKMDSEYNRADQYGIKYRDTQSNALWDELEVDAYTNDVDHLMTDKRRKSALMLPNSNSRPAYVLQRGYFMLTQAFSGVDSIVFDAQKELDPLNLEYGVEWLERSWDANNRLGAGMPNAGPMMEVFNEFVPDALSETLGGYIQITQDFDSHWKWRAGLRVDSMKSSVKEEAAFLKSQWGLSRLDRSDTEWSGYLLLQRVLDDSSLWYAGVGQTVRGPNAQERYLGLNRPGTMPNWLGNPELEPVKNRELSLGFESTVEAVHLRGKAFLSYLDDYIYTTKLSPALQPGLQKYTQTYTNLDARIYGFDLSARWDLNEHWNISSGLAWQQGKKRSQPLGVTNDRLGEMPPLKGFLSFAYEKDDWSVAWSTQVANRQDAIDTSIDEFEVPGYAVHNLILSWQFHNQASLSVAVDNIFDKTYAVNNAYVRNPFASLALINEPGRWAYMTVRLNY